MTLRKTKPSRVDKYVLFFQFACVTTDWYKPDEDIFIFQDGEYVYDVKPDDKDYRGWLYYDELLEIIANSRVEAATK